jgi:hypothetical protein
VLKSNWDILFAALIAIGGIVLAFSFANPVSPGLPQRDFEPARSIAYKPGGTACAPKNLAIAPKESATDAIDRCAKELEEYRLQTDDLIQQMRAADGAHAQAWIAYQGNKLSFLEVLGGFITLIAAIAAAVYARQAGRETKRAADAAHEDLLHAKEVTKIQLRAYLDLEEAEVQKSNRIPNVHHRTFNISVKYKNFGQTPALHALDVSTFIFSADEPAFPDEFPNHCQMGRVVHGSDYTATDTFGVSDDQYDAIQSGKTKLWMLGRCNYEDIYGTKYQFYYRVAIADFENQEIYNYSEPEEIIREDSYTTIMPM